MKNPVSAERQAQFRELFEKASDLPAGERSAFLDESCGNDRELRAKVSALLAEAASPDSPVKALVNDLIWPALRSLGGDASKLDSWLDDRLRADLEEADPLVGRTVSHFEIQEPIGRGGMGMVYRARDQALDRIVALKFLPPSLSSDTNAKNRFIHEAKAASGLNHPNIATVYEIGETGDHQLFIAMGYYPGVTLKAKIEHGSMIPEEVIAIAIQLATGLKNAHEHGVIHRDIKPGNIMMGADGTVVLLDFGLAKLSHESSYTQIGQMMGTIAYMSPEQARGDSVDQRTDIWSFGVVLYELLTGRPPFRGDNVQTVIRAILEEDPKSPAILDGKKPQSIRTVLGLCLAKDPDRRYQSAGDLLEDLQRVQEGLAPKRKGGRATWNRRSRRWQWALAGVFGVAALVSSILIFKSGATTSPLASPPVRFTRITEGALVEDVGQFLGSSLGDFDGDGRLDVAVADISKEGTLHLYRNVGDGRFHRLTEGILVTDPVSPFGLRWADPDNDGDLDAFVIFDEKTPNRFYRNEGAGVFSRITEGDWVNTPSSSHSMAWGDYDNDGLLDLYVANAGLEEHEANFLYHNLGDGKMEAVQNEATRIRGMSHGCIWTDYDSDGDVDLLVAGQFPLIYRNDGEGVFTGISSSQGWIPEYTEDTDIGFSSADYDNDGDLDVIYITWKPNPGLLLYRNDQNRLFRDVSHVLPPEDELRAMGVAWGDYDNDGYQDLFITNFIGKNRLYHNSGNGTFSQITDSPVVSQGNASVDAAFVDFDDDGDLDVFATNGFLSKFGQSCELYRNEGGTNHWLVVKLVGTLSNRSAIGTKVWAHATIRGNNFMQLREIQSGGNGQNGTDLRVHFGLGDAATIDTLRIEWPSGQVQEMRNVAANQFLTIEEEASGPGRGERGK